MRYRLVLFFTLAASACSRPEVEVAKVSALPEVAMHQSNKDQENVMFEGLQRCLRSEGFRIQIGPAEIAPAVQYLSQASEKERLNFRARFGYTLLSIGSPEYSNFLTQNGISTKNGFSDLSNFERNLDPSQKVAYSEAYSKCTDLVVKREDFQLAGQRLKEFERSYTSIDDSRKPEVIAWSHCIKSSMGFTFKNRHAFTLWITNELKEGRLDLQGEKSAALAEATCTGEVGLPFMFMGQ
jgi:hypothetical protein